MAIALILAALVVAPAAARSVPVGGTVYVGEESLDVSAIFGGAPSGYLVHFSDFYDRTIVGSPIVVADTSNFDLTATAVGSWTGTWYAFPIGTNYADPMAAPAGTVLVHTPSTNLRVLLGTSGITSVDGQSVSRSSAIRFRVDHNLAGLADPADPAYNTIEVRLTLPGGGTVTSFGSPAVSLRMPLTGQWTETAPINLAGATAGTYTARGVWPTAAGLGTEYNTNTVTFEVASKAVGITSNKDSVVRGNAFTVTIAGESECAYFLTIENPGSQPPTFRANQVGVMLNSAINVTVRTTAAGTRSVELTTNQSTRDASYTLCVIDPHDPSRYDEVRVRVEKGAVTIMTSGTGVYAIGEEITLSGTNTDSDTTYLFLTGPNLAADGVMLGNLSRQVENYNPTTFTQVAVEADDTWSYRWDTASVGGRILDAGIYTGYAVAQPLDRDSLSDVQYSTASLQLRPPSLSAGASTPTLIPGEELLIFGTATGAPDSVRVWIFGPDCRRLGDLVVVENDGTFEYILSGAETGSFVQKDQYYVVVQHPSGAEYEVWVNDTGYLFAPGIITPVDLTQLQPSDAVNALIDTLESPYVGDIYTKFSFKVVEESRIWIDQIDDLAYGETVTITGDTSYPAGTVLAYRITAEEDGARVLSGEVAVADGGSWSFDVNTAAFGVGTYVVKVTSPDGQISTSMPLSVCDNLIHPITPTGATYRIESIRTEPSLNDLSFGESFTLVGTIDAPWTGYQGSLEFSTDLEDSIWSYVIERDGEVIYSGSRVSRSLTLSAFELDYGQDVRLLISLSGIVPEGGSETPALLTLIERNAKGDAVPVSEYHLLFTPESDAPAPSSSGSLTLVSGWNFVSVPRPLAAGNDTAAIFADVDADGHSAFRYDTVAGDWIALQETDPLAPLEGIWIYSAGPAAVPLTFSTNPRTLPAERALDSGWNAIGITGTAPVTARDVLYSVNGQWATLMGFDAGHQVFETAVINGGSGEYADDRMVYQGRGYWLYMTGPGTLCAIGV